MSEYMDRYSSFLKFLIKKFHIPNEQRYGRKAIVEFAKTYIVSNNTAVVVDIAAGQGTDLINIKSATSAQLEIWGGESYFPNIRILKQNDICTFEVDLERDKLPFENGSVDIIVANQILEHTKEVWWIMSEITRVLKPNGIAIIGVPNLASMHCRVSLLFGKQPPCMEMHGPHVRGFTYKDFKWFVEDGEYLKVDEWHGSGYYTIIPGTAKLMAKMFPGSAVCLTFCVRRTDKQGDFLDNLHACKYETNYYDGGVQGNYKIQ